jgi:hypothetical protein
MQTLDPVLAAQLVAQQTPCPVVPEITVGELVGVSPELALAIYNGREEVIANMDEYPLECCWVPRDWWVFLHLLCQRRLRFPGAVLELYVSGGIRSGKSFVCAMLIVAHLIYTRNANVFCLSRTDNTSQKLQQKPIEGFMLEEFMGGEKGAIKQTRNQKLKFSAGKFTDNKLARFIMVADENGKPFKGGGEMEFRFFSQEVESYRGYALTCVWSDEAVPINHVEAIYDRIVSRAVDTVRPEHRQRMAALEPMLAALAAGTPGAPRPHPAQLGALMHGVHLISYTPEEGYTPTVRRYMAGARKPEEFMVVAPELDGKPGVTDPRVPRVAFPADETRLVGYLHTAQNKMVDSYTELSRKAMDWDERTIRIKLYGDAEAAEERLYSSFGDVHLTDWARLPRQGTIYEVVDPGGSKPWVIMWFICDVAGRHWIAQEWPSPGWLVDGYDLGAWAVPSKGDRVNGDAGPAQKTRLAWSRAHYVRQIWEGRKRLVDKMAATGAPWEGVMQEGELEWKQGWTLKGKFALPERSLMDSRFAAAPTESKGVHTTVLEAMYDEEHAIAFDPAAGVSLEEGDCMINAALNDRIMDLPGLLVNAECQNALFMFRTYTLPPFRETTSYKDEACKDFRDPIAYYLLSGPEHLTAMRSQCVGGGSY